MLAKTLETLAKEMETKFNTKAIISLEFEDLTTRTTQRIRNARGKITYQFPANRYSLKPKDIRCLNWMA